jgi:hypothetical protein
VVRDVRDQISDLKNTIQKGDHLLAGDNGSHPGNLVLTYHIPNERTHAARAHTHKHST